jgi:cysteine desulfurase/selenocysteine lyase
MYFDNAATTFPKPTCVCDAADHWMRCGAAAAGRGSHQGTNDAARIIAQCRTQLAKLLGVPSPEQVVFTLNCTDSLNTVFHGFLNRGDRVLASSLDHNSVLRPLQAMKEQTGISVDMIKFDPLSGLIDMEMFARELQQQPVRLVVLTHASNVTGRIQPVRELAQLAHAAGAAVLLDAAQTAGHIDVRMADWQIDFLAAAGHKGLLGPLGTGVLCIRRGLESQLQPLRFGGTGTASESLEQPGEMPERYESGNLNLPGIAGLQAATDWILKQSVSELHSASHQRIQRLLQGLSEIPNIQLQTPFTHDITGIVSFTLASQDCREVAMILDQSFDLQCRAGFHCAPLAHQTLGTFEQGGSVRLSPGVFTSDEQIQQAIEAVAAVAQYG